MRILTIKRKGCMYAIDLFPLKFWWEVWKPVWHENRGHYISIGLWFVAFYRGY